MYFFNVNSIFHKLQSRDHFCRIIFTLLLAISHWLFPFQLRVCLIELILLGREELLDNQTGNQTLFNVLLLVQSRLMSDEIWLSFSLFLSLCNHILLSKYAMLSTSMNVSSTLSPPVAEVSMAPCKPSLWLSISRVCWLTQEPLFHKSDFVKTKKIGLNLFTDLIS